MARRAWSCRTQDELPETDEDYYFYYSSTQRIFGKIPDLDEITKKLGLCPTDTHRRGERIRYRSEPLKNDMWSYLSPVPEERRLDVHIQTLWAHIKPHKDYLMGLKERLTVDVFYGYRSNCGTAGIKVSHHSLEMFIELEIPFGLSIIY